MKNDFVAEILCATEKVRSGDPSGATAIIQAALAAGGLTSSGPAFRNDAGSRHETGASGAPRQAGPHIIDGEFVVEDGVPEEEADINAHFADRPRAGSDRADPLRARRSPRPLGDVLRILGEGRKARRRGGMQQGPGFSQPDVSAPEPVTVEGSEFRNLQYSCRAGARRYRLYIPASASNGLNGLVVMLHGCTQNPETFAAGTGMNTLAEEHRLLVVYPEQTSAENTMSCWNWFRPGDQTRNGGEPAIIAGLTKSIRDEFGTPHDRVYVAGLSAGGAMAAIMGETYPDLYDGIGVHSGLAYGSANDVVSAFSAMRGQVTTDQRRAAARSRSSRVIVFHGSADSTVHPSNADRIIAGHPGHASASGRVVRSEHPSSGGKRAYTRTVTEMKDGIRSTECWIVAGAPHAWSGGSSAGTYTDPDGPDASAAMVRFFLNGSSDAAARGAP